MLFKTNKELVVPTIVSIIFSFLYFLFFPILSIYFKSLGINDQLLGVIFAFFPLVTILCSPVVGVLSDFVGRKRIIYIGILFMLVTVLLYLWPATIASIIIARIFTAISWSMVGLITLAKIEDKLKENERGEKAGIFFSLTQVGILVGAFLGPFLASMFTLRFPFMMSAIGLALLLVWLFVWKSHHKPVIRKQHFNPMYSIKKFWKEKKLRAMSIIGMAMHTRISVFAIFLPLLVLQMGAGLTEVGIIFGLRGAAHMFQGFAGKIVDKKGSRNIVVGSVIMASVLVMMAGFAKSYIPLLILLVLESFVSSFWNVSAWTFMSEIGERKKMEGMVVGSYDSLANIGRFVFSIASGFIAVWLGISSLFIIAGAISLITVLAFSPMLASKFRVSRAKA